MLDRNDTRFAAIGFEQYHRDGDLMAVIAVRGRFIVQEDGSLSVHHEQGLELVDVYEGDPHKTPLLKPTDLVPFKPAADLTVLAYAQAPESKKKEHWDVGARVQNKTWKASVTGPRHWRYHDEHGWELVGPEPAFQVLLDHRLAASDMMMEEPFSEVAPLNSIGPRSFIEDKANQQQTYRAASLFAMSEGGLIEDPVVAPGPQAPFWRSRHQFAGTYDQDWIDNRHPMLPLDFDYRFYQYSHPNLILDDYFKGDESIELARIIHQALHSCRAAET